MPCPVINVRFHGNSIDLSVSLNHSNIAHHVTLPSSDLFQTIVERHLFTKPNPRQLGSPLHRKHWLTRNGRSFRSRNSKASRVAVSIDSRFSSLGWLNIKAMTVSSRKPIANPSCVIPKILKKESIAALSGACSTRSVSKDHTGLEEQCSSASNRGISYIM